MYCSKCGNELIEGSKFCDKCGVSLVESEKKKNSAKMLLIGGIVLLVACVGLGIFLVNIKNKPIEMTKDIAQELVEEKISNDEDKEDNEKIFDVEELDGEDDDVESTEKTKITVLDYSEDTNENGEIDTKTIYDYDERGNKIECTVTSGSAGVFIRQYTWDYDEDNRCIKEKVYDSKIEGNNYVRIYKYAKERDDIEYIQAYDEDNKLKSESWIKDNLEIKSISYEDGKISIINEYEYDEYGNISRRIISHPNSKEATSYWLYEMVYDANNNVVISKRYVGNDLDNMLEDRIYIYEYYGGGTKKKLEVYENGELINEIEYDEQENITITKYSNGARNINYYKEIEVIQ